MHRQHWLVPILAVGLLVGPAAAATSSWEVDTDNTVPGTVANALIADGEGDDWTGAYLKIDLTSGSVYNAPGFDSLATQAAFWAFVPGLQWDSAVGIADDGSAGIGPDPGGALDPCEFQNYLGGSGPCGSANIRWFNTALDDTAAVQIANITLTDDAAGTWELIASFANGTVRTNGSVANGVIPEPGTLALLGLCGLSVLRRHRVASGLTLGMV